MKTILIIGCTAAMSFASIASAEKTDVYLGYGVGEVQGIDGQSMNFELEHRFDDTFFVKGDYVSGDNDKISTIDGVEILTFSAGALIPMQNKSNLILSGGASRVEYQGQGQKSSIFPFVELGYEKILAQKDVALEISARFYSDDEVENEEEFRIGLKKKLEDGFSIELENTFSSGSSLPKLGISKVF